QIRAVARALRRLAPLLEVALHGPRTLGLDRRRAHQRGHRLLLGLDDDDLLLHVVVVVVVEQRTRIVAVEEVDARPVVADEDPRPSIVVRTVAVMTVVPVAGRRGAMVAPRRGTRLVARPPPVRAVGRARRGT